MHSGVDRQIPFRLRSGLAAVLILILGCAHGAIAGDGDFSPTEVECSRVKLDPQPVWAFNGLWFRAGQLLVITDPGAGVLRLYDSAGRHAGTVARPGQGPLEFNRPSAIWPVSGGWVLKDATRFLWINEDLAPVRSYDLEAIAVASGGTVRALFDIAASGLTAYGAGDALLPDGSWRRGLIAMDLADPTRYRMVRELPDDSRQEFDHYLMGYQLVTVLGPRGYFLSTSKAPGILESDGSGTVRRLTSFPEGFESLPTLPLHTGMTGSEVRYRAYELARLPVGLYGKGERLYVLAREPISEADGGGTRWTLTRIDPEADRVEGSVVLPTRAAHLTVIPGPERWAVLEKGRVERYGVQPIPTLLLVPSEWIEASRSPLAVEELDETLCAEP